MAGGLTWTVFRRYLYAQPGHRTGYGTSRKGSTHTHEDDRDMRREDKEPRKSKMMRIPEALEALVTVHIGYYVDNRVMELSEKGCTRGSKHMRRGDDSRGPRSERR